MSSLSRQQFRWQIRYNVIKMNHVLEGECMDAVHVDEYCLADIAQFVPGLGQLVESGRVYFA